MSGSESALFDLEWLTHCYQSEIGIKSSGGIFEQLANGVHIFGGGGHEMSAKALAASARASRIVRALSRVGSQNLSVLIHSYDPMPRMPRNYAANYGAELAGICWKIRPPKGTVGQSSIKAWAKARLDRAHVEYLKQKRELANE